VVDLSMERNRFAALESLLSRRSVSSFIGSAPTTAELTAILHAAVTVPDHGGLHPWRLVVVTGDARGAFGDALADAAREHAPHLDEKKLDRVRAKAFVAPALIALVARVDTGAKVPVWEQVASAACAGYAITLAAHQLGLGAMWKSSPFVDGAQLRTTLDMGDDDQFLGWVNVGHVDRDNDPAERADVDLAAVVRWLSADGSPSLAPT
jgi:nitroreductase